MCTSINGGVKCSDALSCGLCYWFILIVPSPIRCSRSRRDLARLAIEKESVFSAFEGDTSTVYSVGFGYIKVIEILPILLLTIYCFNP